MEGDLAGHDGSLRGRLESRSGKIRMIMMIVVVIVEIDDHDDGDGDHHDAGAGW